MQLCIVALKSLNRYIHKESENVKSLGGKPPVPPIDYLV